MVRVVKDGLGRLSEVKGGLGRFRVVRVCLYWSWRLGKLTLV